MKLFSLCAIALLSATSAHAVGAPALCENGEKEITRCVAHARIPVYAFAAVCQDSTGAFNLMLDAGRNPTKDPVVRTENETAVGFKADNEEIPNLGLTVMKRERRDNGTNATLSYNLFGRTSAEFTCTPIAE